LAEDQGPGFRQDVTVPALRTRKQFAPIFVLDHSFSWMARCADDIEEEEAESSAALREAAERRLEASRKPYK
jgi:hypothetical protein